MLHFRTLGNPVDLHRLRRRSFHEKLHNFKTDLQKCLETINHCC